MADFSATVAAQLAGRRVRMAFLVEFSFASGSILVWNGNGDLVTSDAKTWKGLRGLGQIDGLEMAVNGAAPQAAFTLSGVDPTARAKALGDPADYVNQPVRVSVQFFGEDWSTLDAPYAIWGGTMQTLQRSRAWDDGKKAWAATVGVTAESSFAGRGRPPYSSYSDRDQQSKYPGDKGLQFMGAMQNYTVRWPVV